MTKSEFETLFSTMKKAWQQDRADTQMTLCTLLKTLDGLHALDLVEGFKRPHSYRGYYDDVAFEPAGEKMKVCDLIAICKSAIGKTFEGWKGGSFEMDETTPVWIAERGESGKRLIAINTDGSLETSDDD
jgi:hypothetical protein